ncbi:hypothetical protein THAOC_20762 [Thalassiosira oceanica]|uniref:Uncharacterized protein n=1 Tax=Thalassiosira oceanica TaxID=159749 RepID=K0RZ24_THAOC|nr:hypothetical protein THAOC_20762 [Thalassiosira oceanica]|eukprot:EJK59063.1 hypothetical protein THAOC_20762 [Thalassiosira oceanica]
MGVIGSFRRPSLTVIGVNTMLPSKAPLSTFQVITQSRASIDLEKKPEPEDITALSCVFRAGRQGAATDHDSILFDVDVGTGLIKGGTTNAHWYRLGLLETLPGKILMMDVER